MPFNLPDSIVRATELRNQQHRCRCRLIMHFVTTNAVFEVFTVDLGLLHGCGI